MTASGGDTLTKLHLKQGESSARSWELVSASVATTLTVGAGADCNWVVHADGVRARHLTLQWDGDQLRVADLAGAGDASLNGQVLGATFELVPDGAQLVFGKALLSVESESKTRPDVHPLDLGMPAAPAVASAPPVAVTSAPATATSSVVSAPPAGASNSVRKQTLLGVAPITLEPPAAKGGSSAPPGGDGFRVLRPSESGGRRPSSNPPAPPLVGSVQPQAGGQPPSSSASAEPPAPAVEVMSAAPGDAAPAISANKAAAMRSGTLIGVAVPEIMHSLRTKRSGSLADDEQRTLHGYVAPPPGSGSGESVARAGTVQVRGDGRPGPAADATQRIGSAWQESPFNGVSAFGGGDPRATLNETRPSGVLDSPPGAAAPAVDTWPAREAGATEPLAGAPLTNTTPAKAGLPLRYVGIAVLTVVAYFAWLYLLDHL